MSQERSQDDRARDSTVAHTEPPKLNLKRLETIQRLLQYGALLILLVFIGLIGLSWFQLRRLNRAREAARTDLLQKRREIDQLKTEADKLRAEKNGLQKVNGALTVVTRSLGEESPAKAQEVKQAIEQSIAPASDAPANEQSQIPARIYIQIRREDQRKRANEIARKLQAAGYIVPGLEQENGEGLENVHLLSPRVSQIRYYQNNEASQKDINDIVSLVRGMGIELKQVLLPLSNLVRARHYEIWFGEDF